MQYKNEYGTVKLVEVSEYMPVKNISKDIVPADCFFSMDEAEKIALITENKNCQIGVCYPDRNKAYLIHHANSNTAAIVKAEVNFTSDVLPTDEIARLAVIEII